MVSFKVRLWKWVENVWKSIQSPDEDRKTYCVCVCRGECVHQSIRNSKHHQLVTEAIGWMTATKCSSMCLHSCGSEQLICRAYTCKHTFIYPQFLGQEVITRYAFLSCFISNYCHSQNINLLINFFFFFYQKENKFWISVILLLKKIRRL